MRGALRLLRDRWQIRRSTYRQYQRTINSQLLQLVKIQPSSGRYPPSDRASTDDACNASERLAGGADRLQRVTVPDYLRPTHELLVSAWRFAETAVDIRYDASRPATSPSRCRPLRRRPAPLLMVERSSAKSALSSNRLVFSDHTPHDPTRAGGGPPVVSKHPDGARDRGSPFDAPQPTDRRTHSRGQRITCLRSIEDRLHSPAVTVLPDMVTRAELHDRLFQRVPQPVPSFTLQEREALLTVACSAAVDAGVKPPFRIRPGLVGAMLDFFDSLKRHQKSVNDFERLALGRLDGGADHDRGAERLVRTDALPCCGIPGIRKTLP
jgi:hypothetical protein